MPADASPRLRRSGPIVPAMAALVPSALISLGARDLGLPPHPAAIALFACDLLLLGTIVFGCGWAITGRAAGIALGSWNDYSLSKLQVVLWTIVVLGAFVAIASLRLLGFFGFAAAADPLDIAIPGPLLAAMGIAAFTSTATPSILALKSTQPGQPPQIAAARQRQIDATGGQATDFAHTGQTVGRTSAATASWIDIVTGDELANAGTVDLSKVQHLLVTLLLLGTYIGLVMRQLAGASHPLAGLPDPGSAFVELLAISHAGYLAYKVAPKSGRSLPAAAPEPAPMPAIVPPIIPAALPPVPAIASAALPPVPVRLAIDDAAHIAGLALSVDGHPQAIGPTGFVELALDPGRPHRIIADGTRDSRPVRGALTVTPGAGDVQMPLALTLRPEAQP